MEISTARNIALLLASLDEEEKIIEHYRNVLTKVVGKGPVVLEVSTPDDTPKTLRVNIPNNVAVEIIRARLDEHQGRLLSIQGTFISIPG